MSVAPLFRKGRRLPCIQLQLCQLQVPVVYGRETKERRLLCGWLYTGLHILDHA
jgi:hypothetical protein